MAADVWRAQNYSLIRANGAAQSVTALIPPVADVAEDPPANAQLTWVMHLEGESAVMETAVDTANMALTDGSVLYTSVQNSTESLAAE